MPKPPRYTMEHAAAGLRHDFPEIETWPNQFPGYEILVEDPEFTSVCPKTGLPDFGQLTIRYMPDQRCLELKSLKEYLQSYRNLGIFQENIVNRVLEDVVRWAKPRWAEGKGRFPAAGRDFHGDCREVAAARETEAFLAPASRPRTARRRENGIWENSDEAAGLTISLPPSSSARSVATPLIAPP